LTLNSDFSLIEEEPLSPVLSVRLTLTSSPALALTLTAIYGLAETAPDHWASTALVPFTNISTMSMYLAGYGFPVFLFIRTPDSIGCLIKAFTSAIPPFDFPRILILIVILLSF